MSVDPSRTWLEERIGQANAAVASAVIDHLVVELCAQLGIVEHDVRALGAADVTGRLSQRLVDPIDPGPGRIDDERGWISSTACARRSVS